MDESQKKNDSDEHCDKPIQPQNVEQAEVGEKENSGDGQESHAQNEEGKSSPKENGQAGHTKGDEEAASSQESKPEHHDQDGNGGPESAFDEEVKRLIAQCIIPHIFHCDGFSFLLDMGGDDEEEEDEECIDEDEELKLDLEQLNFEDPKL